MTWPTRRRRKKPVARDEVGRILAPSEHLIQVRLLNKLEECKADGVIAFAVPNQGNRSAFNAAKMKAEGLRAGVADLCIMMPRGRVAWLELKKPGGRLSQVQKDFRDDCAAIGHPWGCAFSVNEALVYLSSWGALRVPFAQAAE